jgi:hypothetical protein
MRWNGKKLTLAGLGLAALLAGPLLAQGGLSLDWYTVDGGGGSASGGGMSLAGTIGQPDPGGMSGGGLTVQGGFWAGVLARVQPTGSPPPPATPIATPDPSTLTQRAYLPYSLRN